MTAADTDRLAATRADVIVIGGGVIGLSTAYELARAGATVAVVRARHPGTASAAAAGLLAPSIGTLDAAVQSFFDASLRRYPAFVAELQQYDPSLTILRGLVEILDDGDSSDASEGVICLGPDELLRLEPHAAPGRRGRLHHGDGAIDNVRLVAALAAALADQARASLIDATADEIASATGEVRLDDGRVLRGGSIVLAAGAWSPLIRGLPRPIPVAPLKGQMLAVGSDVIQHAIMGRDVYLVPRPSEVVIGATAEHAGFDTSLDDSAIEDLRQRAMSLVPRLGDAPVIRRWAGTRPATPDMLPIIGPDPEQPRLIYACGHSKNGILLAPATAAAIVAMISGESVPDVSPFAISRFPSATRGNS